MVQKLEKAGLGYHMKQENIQGIPMRRLVYRVNQIPESLSALIWDFGILSDLTEKKYILQIVSNRIEKEGWSSNHREYLVAVLTKCQQIMRSNPDECSFVSLRDVNRCLDFLSWFLEKGNLIIGPIKDDLRRNASDLQEMQAPDDFTIHLTLSIACSYYIRLENRSVFFSGLISVLSVFGSRSNDESIFLSIIDSCQNLFINQFTNLKPPVCRNGALKENLWIMTICIELKIPLFLVGKPGTSKSLAKVQVSDIMQGQASYSDFFKNFKEIQVLSFQCSPIASSTGILSTFRQCQIYQKKQDLKVFASVVVLDEIGLAEDSPKMPLKVLHPLLENGCIEDEKPEEYQKVAFVGISNWALDPAKMNRGIFISRGKLSKEDLLNTARDIFIHNEDTTPLEEYLEDIVDAYLEIYDSQDRDFYGLRDFYSLIKMLYQTFLIDRKITPGNLHYAIHRCFGGCSHEMKSAKQFVSRIKSISPSLHDQNNTSSFELIKAALADKEENRYLLLLTENGAALRILLDNQDDLFSENVYLVFGSSFLHDQNYMQLCKNINRIKLAMEMGHTIILCNLANLYESLYDALNQSYAFMGGSRYVDLGLGLHRVKCRVHETFRLIVVAEDKEVFQTFPIPLINRFEKHYLTMDTLITNELESQQHVLNMWIKKFTTIKPPNHLIESYVQPNTKDVFIGYHSDVPASLLIQAKCDLPIEFAKNQLISCATPDSIIRLEFSDLQPAEVDEAYRLYSSKKELNSLTDAIKSTAKTDRSFLQITTHGSLLSLSSKKSIASNLSVNPKQIKLISLNQIETEKELNDKLDSFLTDCQNTMNVFILQYSIDMSHQNANLIDSTRFLIDDTSKKYLSAKFHIVLLIEIPRNSGIQFLGFSHSPWNCLHIDEVYMDHSPIDIQAIRGKTIAQIFDDLHEEVFIKLFVESFPMLCGKIEPIEYDRTMERINILSDIMKDESIKLEFVKILKRKSLQFASSSTENHDLISNLSLQSTYLLEGHTFQGSLWLTLLDEIQPCLVNALQFCDISKGLDHLKSGSSDWMKIFYLSIFDKLDGHPCRQLQLPSNFSTSLPFAWTFINDIEKIYLTDPHVHPATLFNAVKEMNLHSHLINIFKTQSSEAVLLFVKDLIKLKYPNLSGYTTLENNLICQIDEIAKQQVCITRIKDEFKSGFETETSVMPSDLYLAFMTLNNSTKVLNDSITFCQKYLNESIIQKIVDKVSQHDCIAKIALDIIVIDLDPTKYDLTSANFRQKWTTKLKEFRIILQRYISFEGSSVEDLVQKNSRLEIMRLFVESIISDQLSTKKLCQSLNSLGARLTDSCDLKRKSTFDVFLKFLSKLSVDTAKLIFCGGVDACFLCTDELTEPVALPCDHVACWKCLISKRDDRLRSNDNWNCPKDGCKRNYPADHLLERTVKCESAVKKHQLFRKNVQIFFQEILQRYIFVGNTPPDREVIQILLKFAISKHLTNEEKILQKLTPFVDATPVLRSLIFTLILKSKILDIDEYLNSNLPLFNEDPENNAEVCLLLLYCLEDALLENQPDLVELAGENIQSANEEILFFEKIVASTIPVHNSAVVDTIFQKLQFTAKLRICLSHVAKWLHNHISKKEPLPGEITGCLDKVQDLMKNTNQKCLFTFLVKEIASKHSSATILEWKLSSVYSEMMLTSLQSNELHYYPDYCCVIGEHYTLLRNKISETFNSSENVEIPEDPKLRSNYRLACFYFMKRIYNTNSEEETFDNKVSQLLKMAYTDESHLKISENLITLMREWQSPTEKSIGCIIFHFFEMLLFHGDTAPGIINFFYQLTFFPNTLEKSYFPTMPQDDLADILNMISTSIITGENTFTRFYRCSNGHPYGVGNCGQLNQSGRCHCGVSIGRGSETQVLNNNNHKDQSGVGYILDPEVTTQMITGVRKLNTIQVCTIQVFLHACMLLCTKKDHISSLIKAKIQPQRLPNVLLDCMKKNISELSRSLERSEDHIFIYLHLVVENLRKPKSSTSMSLDTKEAREIWETQFCQELIDDESLNDACGKFQNRDIKLEADNNSILHSILKKSEVASFHIQDLPYAPVMWEPRIRICLANISHHINEEQHKTHCPLFSLIIKNQVELSKTHHLVSILKLQSSLVQQFNRHLDRADLETTTIDMFLQRFISNEIDIAHFKELIHNYLQVFNDLSLRIFSYDKKGKIAGEHFYSHNDPKARMDITPCGILFPSAHGFGLCAKMLVKVLIDTHNSTLKYYLDNEPGNEQKIDPCTVDSSQIIACDRENLENLILLNTQYELHSGSATKRTIDLDSLERQVKNRYFIGRVLLDDKQIPVLKFSGEDDDLKDQPLMIPQCHLPSMIRCDIESVKDLPPLCLLLNYCQKVRYLLAVTLPSHCVDSTNCLDKTTSLKTYMQMTHFKIDPYFIGKRLLENIHLEYLDDSILFLKVERAKRIILLNQNPWQGLIKRDMQVPVDDNLQEKLQEVLLCIPRTTLLTLLYRFLEEFIVSGIIDIPDYTIAECLEDAFDEENVPEARILIDNFASTAAKVPHAYSCFNYFVHRIEAISNRSTK